MRWVYGAAWLFGGLLGAALSVLLGYAALLSDLPMEDIQISLGERLGLDRDPACDPAAASDPQAPCVAVLHVDLPAGATIEREDLEFRVWPAMYLADEVLRSDPTGRVTRLPILRGETVRSDRLQ